MPEKLNILKMLWCFFGNPPRPPNKESSLRHDTPASACPTIQYGAEVSVSLVLSGFYDV